MSDRRRDDDILDVLDELGDTLDELGAELREERDRNLGRRVTGDDRFRPPRPPTFGEVLRFTESYTIPTVIAVLEATIASLELLRRLMRLSDPGRAMDDARGETEARMRNVPKSAVSGVDRALDELRNALSEADLPSNPEARDVMDRARSLADELDARLSEAERERTARERRWREDERTFESEWQRRDDARRSGDGTRTSRDAEPVGTGPVRIDVTEEAGPDGGDDGSGSDEPTVDVDAELESIKREVNGDDETDGTDAGAGDEPSDR
ncbi:MULTISPECIES: hypothetical protein [unclassified Haloferax]|uniref:DUF7547 family protein n=1 Tax=Haloferax TaxID=2251 RepID=UPI0002B1E8C0|nr:MULTISPECIES: hypothetical protein [unclassified Haloferax]ELZ59724.1 hypothetical protein C460_06001 [Haloferax sp. ATCC BAA-646]ELZ64648.1 hypothetical protein C459_08965 [Haloferax sp. ATCC BAA-645]ELZ69518.1 hypothetical protein C458_04529 [Haloferax sp. ATCC BAA-644]